MKPCQDCRDCGKTECACPCLCCGEYLGGEDHDCGEEAAITEVANHLYGPVTDKE